MPSTPAASHICSFLILFALSLAGNEVKTEPLRRKAIQDLDQEAKARRQAHLEQRHLEAYWSMHHLRDALHHHYAALLKDKVDSQRLTLQQRHETARAKSEKKMKKPKKLSFSKLQHDDSYLESLPKTSYYLMLPGIDLKHGKKSQTDQPALSSVKQPSVQRGRPTSHQKLSEMISASHQCFETLVRDTAMCCHKTPDPLSIEDVCQQKHVKIIDRGLKQWKNYTENTDY
ncbi:hypothetical protein PFLUV_G00224670 [Scomber scombrus]|uniref:Uncharacterized protein n=1 Tax=Scomber scombrus TaxID=13677 RepID=A0AAV1MY55_SCOSC